MEIILKKCFQLMLDIQMFSNWPIRNLKSPTMVLLPIQQREGSDKAKETSAEKSSFVLPDKSKADESQNDKELEKNNSINTKRCVIKLNMATLTNALAKIIGQSIRKLNKRSFLSIKPLPAVWPKGNIIVKCLLKLENVITEIKSDADAIEWMFRQRLIKKPVCQTCNNQFIYQPKYTYTKFTEIIWVCGCGNSGVVVLHTVLRNFTSACRLVHAIYCWATRDDNAESLLTLFSKDNIKDTFAVYSSLQSLCNRILTRDRTKLASFDSYPVEVVSVQIGQTFILAAMESKTKAVRLHAFSIDEIHSAATKGINIFIEKVREWVALPSTLRVFEKKFNGLISHGYNVSFLTKSEFCKYGFKTNDENAGGYIISHLQKMFKNIDLSSLSANTMNLLLSELEWREKYGYEPCIAFRNIITHIATDPMFKNSVIDRSLSGAHQANDRKNCEEWLIKNCKSCMHTQGDEMDKTIVYFLNFGNQQNSDTRQNSNDKVDEYYVDEYFYGYWYPTNDTLSASDFYKPSLDIICHLCQMHFNKSNIGKHMIEHLDDVEVNGKQTQADLRIRCNHCLKLFGPKTLHLHKELTSNKLQQYACRICCLPFTNRLSFIEHMIETHWPKEAPYRCNVCKYRSSFQKDVLDHFRKEHSYSEVTIAICPICLAILRCDSPNNLSRIVHGHMSQHFEALSTFSCSNCTLTFASDHDRKCHFLTCHSDPTNSYGTEVVFEPYRLHAKEQIYSIIATRDELMKSKFLKKSDPSSLHKIFMQKENKNDLHKRLKKLHIGSRRLSDLKCMECGFKVTENHFSQAEISCTICTFKTYCLANAKKHQQNRLIELNKFTCNSDNLSWTCECGFISNDNNDLAHHMITAKHYTCHSNKLNHSGTT
ncbi:uncharacterized protein LOC107361787 isoform X2 [Tetranychus urticae]|uniref:uncharacterized protein LOC107361787 isoform X2 n=1 Tax=Tetranychus urticae TaxID=32264 RepID=UPI000D64A6E4|nr:uncharacterized protein LOC107361787 isoform X2 [Tetranychus urticae]